ncbi:hypothetical protein [Amycolatopsis japonica]
MSGDATHLGPDDDPRDVFEQLAAQLTDMPSQLEVADLPSPPKTPTPSPAQAKPSPPQAPAPQPKAPMAAVEVPVPLPQPAPRMEPRMPVAPSAPNRWGKHGLVAVYWIAIATGAIGQVIFFGDLFGLGLAGYFAAAIIATTSETIMVSACDTALAKRDQGRAARQWVPFLLIAFTAAVTASGMNVIHWMAKNPSMAILFGGIAFLGFLLHVIHGFGDGTQYRAEKAAFDAAIAKIEAEEEAEAAEHRRLRTAAARRQMDVTAPAPAEDVKPVTRSAKAKPATKPSTKPSAKSSGKSKMTKDDVLSWALRQPDPENLTPAPVLKHFKERGYELATERAVRNWLADIK